MTRLPFHPVAEAFPLLEGEEFEAFKADIRAHGLMEPIWTWNGQIIDGRNRYNACLDVGVEPKFLDMSQCPEADLPLRVVSLNLRRRHLNESQRGMAAARLKPLFEPGAKQRQIAAQNNNAAKSVPANLQEQGVGETNEQAAELVNVSPRTVASASKVLEKGVPELQKAVDSGQVKVSAAAVVAKNLSTEEQKKVVAKGPKAVKETAKKIVAAKKQAAPSKPAPSKATPEPRYVPSRLITTLTDLRRVIASVNDTDPTTGGWGGFSQVFTELPARDREPVRHQIEQLAERLAEWIDQADAILAGSAGGT